MKTEIVLLVIFFGIFAFAAFVTWLAEKAATRSMKREKERGKMNSLFFDLVYIPCPFAVASWLDERLEKILAALRA